MEPIQFALALAKALDEKKAGDIQLLKTEDLTTLTDYFVLCSGMSTTQINALSQACEKVADDLGQEIHHMEGHRGGTWVLMDYSAVVVHIFQEEARGFYDLERLWSDATPVDLSQVLTPQ